MLAIRISTPYIQGGLRTCVTEGYPLRSGHLSAIGLFNVKMVADRHRHAACHKFW